MATQPPVEPSWRQSGRRHWRAGEGGPALGPYVLTVVWRGADVYGVSLSGRGGQVATSLQAKDAGAARDQADLFVTQLVNRPVVPKEQPDEPLAELHHRRDDLAHRRFATLGMTVCPHCGVPLQGTNWVA